MEAEWEWAARGPEGRRYPWGDTWESGRCNSNESGIDRTSAVGCFPSGAAAWWRVMGPDSEVVHDLAGNVWEWTASEYGESSQDYAKAHQSVLNTNHPENSPRVLRGGSWYFEPYGLRSAARFRFYPQGRSSSRGFRLARTL
jgi:formylglycine-generating enzyme required for sulfatase activity